MAFADENFERLKGGRPAYDRLMMFKTLIVQGLYNLSDDQLEL
jgi:IS5 family transposase